MTITGRTGIYALFGDPIGHAQTPALYNARFRDLGIDVAVVPIHVSPQGLADAVRFCRQWQNLVGIGVTIPHKESMVDLVDELTPGARTCGATNVVRRDDDGSLVGTQMDGPGFVRSLIREGHEVRGATVLVAGAGGTAKAVAFELAAQGVSRITIVNRTAGRAQTLADRLSNEFPHVVVTVNDPGAGQHDFVVNATSLGMRAGDPLPVPAEVVQRGVVVADVVMQPAETPLLRLAVDRLCAIHPGAKMLEAQFAATVDFLGLRPAAENVR